MSEPRKYRKKPVVIEAVQWTGRNHAEVQVFVGGEDRFVNPDDSFLIRTPEGVMRVDVGDWVIRGGVGEFYPCKPSTFDATYEPVENPND